MGAGHRAAAVAPAIVASDRISQARAPIRLLATSGTIAALNFARLEPAASERSADAVIVMTAADAERAAELRLGPYHLLPVVDLSGRYAHGADLSTSVHDAQLEARITEVAMRFAARRAKLGAWAAQSSEAHHRLLAWMWTTEQHLEARYAGHCASGFSHGAFPPVTNCADVADRLATRNLLSRTFFDRFHHCPHCRSARLNVREECQRCRSSDLAEVGLLHHYRCAYLGPEQDFEAAGGRLMCPKCARELRHYGSDHERAGEAISCRACGHIADAAEVGFVCLDCEAHFNPATAMQTTVYHYGLLEQGRQAISREQPEADADTGYLIGELPLAILTSIACGPNGARPIILEIAYTNQLAIESRTGARGLAKARNHFRDIVARRLGRHARVVPGAVFDYVVLERSALRSTPEEIASAARLAIREAAAKLKDDLGVEAKLITVGASAALAKERETGSGPG